MAIRYTGELENRTDNQLLPAAHHFMQMLNCLVPLRLAPPHRVRKNKQILWGNWLASLEYLKIPIGAHLHL